MIDKLTQHDMLLQHQCSFSWKRESVLLLETQQAIHLRSSPAQQNSRDVKIILKSTEQNETKNVWDHVIIYSVKEITTD